MQKKRIFPTLVTKVVDLIHVLCPFIAIAGSIIEGTQQLQNAKRTHLNIRWAYFRGTYIRGLISRGLISANRRAYIWGNL